jgi:hypothetical protein
VDPGRLSGEGQGGADNPMDQVKWKKLTKRGA